jgi:murein L,D-transpeptidase YafK
LKINYPNASDKILSDKRTPGGEIFIHGKCVSIGCIPLTDEKVNELYILAVEATNNGQAKIPVYIFPFEMNDGIIRMMDLLLSDEKLISFWKNLKEGYDKFMEEKSALTVKVDSKGKYLF